MNIKNTLLKIQNPALEELLTEYNLIHTYNLFLNDPDLFKKYYLYQFNAKVTSEFDMMQKCYYFIYLGEDKIDDLHIFLAVHKISNNPYTVVTTSKFKEDQDFLCLKSDTDMYIFNPRIKEYDLLYTAKDCFFVNDLNITKIFFSTIQTPTLSII